LLARIQLDSAVIEVEEWIKRPRFLAQKWNMNSHSSAGKIDVILEHRHKSSCSFYCTEEIISVADEGEQDSPVLEPLELPEMVL
jgi:hypothetical protein